MDDMKTISVTLPGEMVDGLDQAVAAGEYSSRDEALQIAVETLETDKIVERLGVERVRALLREGAESGPGVDGEAVFARLLAKYRRMTEERGK
jgi:Arc/MetJ-type ribon-helix-helix transcriptional regulator